MKRVFMVVLVPLLLIPVSTYAKPDCKKMQKEVQQLVKAKSPKRHKAVENLWKYCGL